MKKITPHILYLLVIAFFIVYVNIKARDAERFSKEVFVQSELATKNADDAKMQTQIAEEMAAEARNQERLASELLIKLEECNRKK